MTVPNTPIDKEELFHQATTLARDRQQFYYELIFILLAHVSPEVLQTALEAALEKTSALRSYHES